MMACKECIYFAPCGNRWMCWNPKTAEDDFVRFVKPDDNYDRLLLCGTKMKGESHGKR